ncbi:hypothetical protein DXG03_000923 [Asterophora parasitica]|uniref:Uncharacterized protein n=1 Tax=Asterophora parasitica TaxID=117018 RepID=A0A9P7GA20_9AGAR|nr:hypothetical protein DXG03_000923 [Asterophora parasitica]
MPPSRRTQRKQVAQEAPPNAGTDAAQRPWRQSRVPDGRRIAKRRAMKKYKLRPADLEKFKFIPMPYHRTSGPLVFCEAYKYLVREIEMAAWEKHGGPDAHNAYVEKMNARTKRNREIKEARKQRLQHPGMNELAPQIEAPPLARASGVRVKSWTIKEISCYEIPSEEDWLSAVVPSTSTGPGTLADAPPSPPVTPRKPKLLTLSSSSPNYIDLSGDTDSNTVVKLGKRKASPRKLTPTPTSSQTLVRDMESIELTDTDDDELPMGLLS